MTIDVHLPLVPMKGRKVKVLFAIPRALKHEEIMKVFRDTQETLREARINVNEHENMTVFNLTYKDPAIEWLIDTPELLLQTYQATPTREKVTLWTSNVDTIESIRGGLNKVGEASIVSMKRVERDKMISKELLTPSQYRVLATLLEHGFWDLPRKGITLKEVAPKLGMSDSTLSLIVREIIGKVLEAYADKMAQIR